MQLLSKVAELGFNPSHSLAQCLLVWRQCTEFYRDAAVASEN